MKRIDLIRVIEGFGWVLVRHGNKHDWCRNPVTGFSQPIPRHREIKEGLSKDIIKMLSNPASDLTNSQSLEDRSA
jgi:mRNA interferase HicA